jgi:hypothetical protein
LPIETSINFMPQETAFLIVTTMKDCNLTKFFNFETSVSVCVRVRAREYG